LLSGKGHGGWEQRGETPKQLSIRKGNKAKKNASAILTKDEARIKENGSVEETHKSKDVKGG